jgi:hypothetical protein
MDWFRGKSTGKAHRKMGNSMVSCKCSLKNGKFYGFLKIFP